jgi:hypothetical protein
MFCMSLKLVRAKKLEFCSVDKCSVLVTDQCAAIWLHGMQNQQAATRAGLVASRDIIEREMEACHENIMALHADLDVAGKQNDEARQDASAARFAAVKCAPERPFPPNPCQDIALQCAISC